MKRRLITFLVFTILGLNISSCSKNSRALTELAPTGVVEDYAVRVGDMLNVAVWGEPNLSGEVFVRDDGKFALKIPGTEDIQAEGKTPQQIADAATTELKKFVKEASVKVSVVQTSPIRFYLSGQFSKPGEYRSDKKITLLQAIATGGGFAPFANESAITIIRRSTKGELRYSLDYNLVIEGREPNPELKDGDVIAVK